KLVNSDEAHDELMSALGSVEKGVTALGDTLGRVQKLRLDVAMESAWLTEPEEARSRVRLDILPQGSERARSYRVDVVSDPTGRQHRDHDDRTAAARAEAGGVLGPGRVPVRGAARPLLGRPGREQRRRGGRLRAGAREALAVAHRLRLLARVRSRSARAPDRRV